MKPSRAPPTPGGRKTPSRNNSREKMVIRDPVEVFCRLRPVSVSDEGYIKVIDNQTLQIATPDRSLGHRGTYKEIQYKFSRVFDEESSQSDVFTRVALSLVESLLKGRNGLLFTYGVTGSGKTFTMTGTPRDSGILPRCLDVLFNSIAGYQSKKFVFKADRLNGFDIQSDVEAMRDRQNEMIANLETPKHKSTRIEFPKTPRRRLAEWEESERCTENARISLDDEDTAYSVFVTYIEIYNNCVYDLLDEPDDIAKLKAPQPRLVREDANGNMYAHGVVEVEVSSSAEAFQVFCRGLKRKTMAHTVLNAESSRSHAVFTLRLVQAPLDGDGEEVIKEKKALTISQLSLVDLAGSERTNRSKTEGARLREAGNINNSLLTLRKCFETLRENQSNAGNGPAKIVPYRDSRLTHLFKNYFDGEGQVRMIVCVNPNPSDYEETVHVMKFAEMSQEVQVTRPTPKRLDLGLTPGRRRANQVFKEAAQRLVEQGVAHAASIPVDLGIVYSLGMAIPNCNLRDPQNEDIIRCLMLALEQRIANRNSLQQQFKAKQDSVRAAIVALERDVALLKQENACLRATMENNKGGRGNLEQRLIEAEAQLVSVRIQLEDERGESRRLRNELENTQMKLQQRVVDSERTKQLMHDKLEAEKVRIDRQMRHRMLSETKDLKTENERKAEKLRQVQQIVSSNGDMPTCPASAGPFVRGRVNRLAASASSLAGATPVRHPLTPTPSRRGPAVSNPRHRRSRSAGGGERWLDHRPATATSKLLELPTVLQPIMTRRKSVSKLTNPRDVTDPQTSKYCLTTQEQDSAGELETKLYKGDVLPTRGGGAQVVLTDVEVLRQSSPTDPRLSPTRKRSAGDIPALDRNTVSERCKTGIEGHAKRLRK